MSERLVKDDVYTSVHLEESNQKHVIQSLGLKKSHVNCQTLVKKPSKTLTKMGIIRIGAEVKEGDILVGKVTPKGEKDLSAEETSSPRYLW